MDDAKGEGLPSIPLDVILVGHSHKPVSREQQQRPRSLWPLPSFHSEETWDSSPQSSDRLLRPHG